MHLKEILIIFSFLLVGCVAPKKPIVELCHIDTIDDLCFCSLTSDPSSVIDNPLEYCDRATAFRPQEWEKVKNYMDELKIYIEEGCR